jgi:hypothetical protein
MISKQQGYLELNGTWEWYTDTQQLTHFQVMQFQTYSKQVKKNK